MEENYFSKTAESLREAETPLAMFARFQKNKERIFMTRKRQPNVRERAAQFMLAMQTKNFAEAKRIRKFTRSMCSPQHWSTECRLWLERNPDAALSKWFEQTAADDITTS